MPRVAVVVAAAAVGHGRGRNGTPVATRPSVSFPHTRFLLRCHLPCGPPLAPLPPVTTLPSVQSADGTPPVTISNTARRAVAFHDTVLHTVVHPATPPVDALLLAVTNTLPPITALWCSGAKPVRNNILLAPGVAGVATKGALWPITARLQSAPLSFACHSTRHTAVQS